MHLFLEFVVKIKYAAPDQEPSISRVEGDWHKYAKDLRGLILSDVPLTWKNRKQVHHLKNVYAISLYPHNFLIFSLNSISM